ncbi:MAG: TonB-dependent receptor [Alphaproteobacteria bacterium]|nr:TonB-dependent receptor [Alphaproteobacteria bacterium]MCB9692694.1 TonB-dependent receptor [Alphaproteobacteria bacterium]
MWIPLLSLAWAAEPVNPFEEVDESELFRLDERLVTVASRYAQTVRKAPSIVTLITAADIRAQGFRTVSEALRTLPGVYIWSSAEGRDLAAIRGVISPDNNKLLVLVDGVPFYDGLYTHGFIGDPLPISAIKQIEVIKGPGSAIYGTNAFTGVVNIVTWGGRDLEGAKVRLLAGSGNRWDLTASGGGRRIVGGTEVTASGFARIYSQDGFGIDVTPAGDRNANGYDPKRGLNVGGQVSVQGLRIQAHHQDARSRFREVTELNDPYDALANDIDAFGLAYSNTFVEARWGLDAGPATLTPFAMVQWYDNPGSYYFTRGFDSTDPANIRQQYSLVETEKTTTRWTVGLDAEARPGIDHRIVAGAGLENITANRVLDVRYDDGADFPVLHDNFTVFDSCGTPAGFADMRLQLDTYPAGPCRSPSLRTIYAYTQYTWTVSPSVELTAGARFDNRLAPVNTLPPDGVGVAGNVKQASFMSLSPRAGILLIPSDTFTAKLLYGRAFRAPTVRELLVVSAYDDGDQEYPSTTGNFQLKPEVINTGEVELTAELDQRFSARFDGNYSQLSSEIDKVDPGLYCNLPGQLSVIGAEAEMTGKVGAVRADLGYALTLARYGGNDNDNNCQDGDRNEFANGDNPYQGRRQYEFPPHMVKGRVGVTLAEGIQLTALGELYSKRPRKEWATTDVLDIPVDDAPAFGLLHATASASGLGSRKNIGMNVTMRNILDTQIGTGQYRDDAADVGVDYQGRTRMRYMDGYTLEGRSLTVGVEVGF